MNFLVNSRVKRPKYYKHLKEAAQHSAVVWAYEKWASFWQITDQVKPRILNNLWIYINFIPEFSIQLRRRFYSKIENLKK